MTPIDLRDVAGLVLDYLPLPSQAILYKTSRVLRGIALRSWPAEARKHLGVRALVGKCQPEAPASSPAPAELSQCASISAVQKSPQTGHSTYSSALIPSAVSR